ncbi:MAG: hypothetical protein LIP01_02100 [Tannerellaceae bacterium]|nr:hypothetical protein [Tannerellaceae bacterium]
MVIECRISAWSCPYHACMSDDCQRSEVTADGTDWGKGKCEERTISLIHYRNMDTDQFIKKVKEMRKAQDQYATSYSNTDRQAAKRLQTDVDNMIKEYESGKLPKQKSFFTGY